MTKTELISAVSESVDLKKKDVESVVISVLNHRSCTAKGDKVQIMGFGTFLVRKRPARMEGILRLERRSTSPKRQCPCSSRASL